MTIKIFRFMLTIGLGVSLSGCSASSQEPPPVREPTTVAQFDRWMDELSNWGTMG